MNKLGFNSHTNSLIKIHGFTIVELLVVIVVIGILASAVIVSYAGINQKAIVATLQSDLINNSQQIKAYQVLDISGNYPDANDCSASPLANTICLKSTGGNTFSYSVNNAANPKTFSLDVTSTNGTKYNITNDSSPIAVSANQWTYEQNMNTLNDGSIEGQDGWASTQTEATFAVQSAGSPYEGAKHVAITGDNPGSDRLDRSFTAIQNGTMYFSFKSSSSTNGYIIFNLLSGSNYALTFGYNGGTGADNLFFHSEGNSWIDAGAFTDNTYYRIGIAFECGAGAWEGLSADTYKYNVDGGAWSDTYAFIGDRPSIDKLSLYTYSDGGVISYFDDISPNY